MNKIIITITCFFSVLAVNAADIYVNNSGQAGTYTTISSAIIAANSGDNIYISSYNSYTEDITIDKSVNLYSSTSDVSFNVIGSLTINCLPSMNVHIVGANFSSQLRAYTGTATLNNKADIYLVESSFSAISGYDFVNMHVLFCDSPNSNVSLEHGEVRGCNVNRINTNEGPNLAVEDTIFIVGNITTSISLNNNDNYFYVANNFINSNSSSSNSLNISRSLFNVNKSNVVTNNTIVSNTSSNNHKIFYLTNSTSGSTWSNEHNIDVYNNIFDEQAAGDGIYASGVLGANAKMSWFNNTIRGNDIGNNVSTQGLNNDELIPEDLEIDILGKSVNSNYVVDKGFPSLEYYDIDMTRNDRGAYGGPNSIDNYHSTAAGKARVFDLNMPFEIWTGQTPQVKASAVHTK